MDENAAGATITAVSTENATETTVDNDHFEVADGNLKLRADSSLDFEAIEGGMLEVNITASGDGESATHTVTITVNDVNEAPMIAVADGETPDGMAASSTVDENVEGAILGAITLSDPDAGQMHTLTTSDDRFVTKQDAEGGWWLALADGVSLDHEAGATVMVTVTVTDDGDPAMSASTDVTITVNDVNEAPTVTGTVAPVTAESGEAIKAKPIDLLALFSDPDDGDAPVRYEMSGNPSWLKFSVEYGEDDDGNDTAHGIVSGEAPKTGADSDAAHKVTLTAADGDGEEASTSFYVIIDDGNDDITDVDFIDNDGNVAVEAEVDENDTMERVLGEIRVHDQDHPMHPNGTHDIQILKGNEDVHDIKAEVDDRFEVKWDAAGIPWLVKSAGKYLDAEKGSVDVIIRAVDKNGATKKVGTTTVFDGNVESQTVSIFVNDKNDAPKANPIGNWWVTAEEGQRASQVDKGEWLDFHLDTDGTDAAFTDPDSGDNLTYSLSGPSFLEIDAKSGRITNKEGGVPVRGRHKVTITATDPDGESAKSEFYLAVALSGEGTDATADEDNDVPDFRVTSSNEIYVENSITANLGMKQVATFTVTDDDNDLGHHPFALDSVRIVGVVSDRDGADDNDQPVGSYNQNEGYGAAFRLSKPVKNGDTWTYHVFVQDTNRSPMIDTTSVLNPDDVGDVEGIGEITITLSITDGRTTFTETIDIDIDDANDKPMAEVIGGAAGKNIVDGAEDYVFEQRETAKQILYIKLEDIWNDEDDDSDDLTFGASVDGAWIKILHGPAEWRDIEDGRDGDAGNEDDVVWNLADTATRESIAIGADADTPSPGEQVVIIEIDRVKNNGQDDKGSFTLTADDGNGGKNSKKYTITITDENLDPVSAVELSGSPREGATLRATFNDDKDPDLAGSAMPALVLYEWFRVPANDDGSIGTEPAEPFHVSTDNTYRLTQDDAGDFIRVKVKYYEVGVGENADQLVGFNTSSGATVLNQADTSRVVSNTPDKGTGHFTILTSEDTNEGLTVADNNNVRVTDGDYSTPGGVVGDDTLTISWEMSDNGRGGWKEVEGFGPEDGDQPTLTLEDGKGKWYRAVATYDADGLNVDADDRETESVYSNSIQASDLHATDAAPEPTISGGRFPGGTLSVNANMSGATVDVQWQEQASGLHWVDIPGATGSSLSLTQAHAGKVIRAVVSYQSKDADGVTAVVAVNATEDGAAISGGTDVTDPPVAVKNYNIEVSVDGTGHPATGDSNDAGHNLSHTETIDLSSLFQAPDGARLSFTAVTGQDASGLTGDGSPVGGTYVWEGGNSSGGVLVFEIQGQTGKLTFNSDVYRNHDGLGSGADQDGEGNVIKLNIDANSSEPDATINLRINVAPTGVEFADRTEDSVDPAAEGQARVNEQTAREAAPGSAGHLIATLDVQDENLRTHDFGTHVVDVDDPRFMVTISGNNARLGDDDEDGSTWDVRLKPGVKLDYEAENADGNPNIVLTFTVTDKGGLSTAPGAANAIKLTVVVEDDESDNVTQNPNNVPGLNDNEATDQDEREDNEAGSGGDDDTDGGSHPPPPGMSIGLIEDFVDNMNGFDQDLLEDFMLIIDDGIDIA